MVPDFLVEQLHLGELDAQTAAEVRAALGAEADPRLADLAAQDAMIQAQYPAQMVVPRILASVPQAGRRWPLVLPALLAAAAGVWLAARPAQTPAPSARSIESVDTVRAKGPLRPVLQVMRAGEAPTPVTADEQLSAGDRVQLRFQPRGALHAVIVSVDGRGATTLHVPDAVDASTALPAGAQRLTVGHAYELDDAPQFERFFLITADAPLDPDALLTAAAEAGMGDLTPPPDARVEAFTLRKSQ